MSLKSVLAKINKARDAYIERQEKKAERELARLKTKTAREKERARLVKERSLAYAEANRAKAVALRAETERKKALRELRGQGFLGQIIRELRSEPMAKRKSTKKKGTRKTRKSRR